MRSSNTVPVRDEVVKTRPKHFPRSSANSARTHVKTSKEKTGTLILVALDKETHIHGRVDGCTCKEPTLASGTTIHHPPHP